MQRICKAIPELIYLVHGGFAVEIVAHPMAGIVQAAGIEAIEKIMADQGIMNHKIAAAYWEKENPPPTPAMPGGTGSWNFLDLPTDDKGDVEIKALIEAVGVRPARPRAVAATPQVSSLTAAEDIRQALPTRGVITEKEN